VVLSWEKFTSAGQPDQQPGFSAGTNEDWSDFVPAFCHDFALCMKFFLLVISSLLAVPVQALQEDANRFIRGTEKRTPEEELKGFHVPEGFEVQLFADDAQLGGKPINMAFDTRGRLWVTSTQEYPFAVKKEKWSADTTAAPGSKDTIRILEDTDGDGRADKVTIFATDLNIPTGVLPYKNGCIAWSIPNILYLEDTDGDGKADKRTILFGPLGYEKDTHGMISSFRLGLDGWVYATHGFSNTSHFAVRPEHRKSTTKDIGNTEKAGTNKTSATSVPSVVKSESFDVTSGSVFRFKPDGSQVELWTSGQVNPFGLCWDSWENLYSADCHSSPIYQLIRGATYPQFGKQPDALGFGPVMCEHAHGSTGICGPLYIDGGIWGAEWDDHMFVCNPVTSKINHDLITFTGSTPKANEKPDFLTSNDLWFHPVDLQLGPDSALYIADFYNRIIGHYEVPLDHPGRDRSSGRIWRVVKKGITGKLVQLGGYSLSSKNLTAYHLAVQDLTESHLKEGQGVSIFYEESLRATAAVRWAVHLQPVGKKHVMPPLNNLWYLESFPSQGGPLMRQAAEFGLGEDCSREDLHEVLKWRPTGQRQAIAAEVLFAQPALESLEPLLQTLQHCPPADHRLIYTLRLAIRKHLELPGAFGRVKSTSLGNSSKKELITVAMAVPSPEASTWLMGQLESDTGSAGVATVTTANRESSLPLGVDRSLLIQVVTHIARHLPAERQGELVDLVQKHFGEDLDTQLDLFSAITAGTATLRSRLSENGSSQTSVAGSKDGINGSSFGEATSENRGPRSRLDAWAASLAKRLTDSLSTQTVSDWSPVASPNPQSASPWFKQMRKCSDGTERAFLCSLPPGGEKLIGTLRSKAFDLPKTLTLWMGGHRGFPNAEAHEKNFVRLVDEESGAEIAKAYPPRNNTPQLVTWELGEPKSKRAHLEITDGDDGTAYAWLAVGGFSPEVVGIPDMGAPANDKRIRVAAELAAMTAPSTIDVESDKGRVTIVCKTVLFPELLELLEDLPHRETLTPDARVALAKMVPGVKPTTPEIVELTRDDELAPFVFQILSDGTDDKSKTNEAFRTLSTRAQIKLASALASSQDTAAILLRLANASVLADPLVSGKLNALNDADISKQLKAATASLPPRNDALNKLIAQRLKSFDPAKADTARGQDVFMRTCSVCHRIGVKGNLVGPQLDGVGARGAERLIEDIMDPNRAVDPAFRLHIVKLKSGGLMTGLLRREQDDEIIFADAAGQEHTVKKADVGEDQVSAFSLMPSGFGEILKEQELHDLMGFLLQRKS
jgi:putative membrane-bound dehydrogenase-like protein